ncbi:lasso peptide biosynthesis PqqD family chaperone [Streptomyces sp. NRRL S-118]|uniref:lasso peptide biosynthesis PqqD family chaperone n=1 Tax=Streptomyces sp. NRRL S-118 TaxID=1463881 RepID=UPI000A947DE2|nr:lasso peptide biosynthesis PqqD family chaperone [Streptomyces sp. NRRL S-118]
MTPTRPLTLCPDVTACDTDDGMVLLDGRRGRYWQLNATGALILRALLRGDDGARIAEELACARPVTAEQAGQDISDLITRLTEARLVEEQTTP